MNTLIKTSLLNIAVIVSSSSLFANDQQELVNDLGQEALTEIKQDFKKTLPTLDDLLAEVQYEKEIDTLNAENETEDEEAKGLNAAKVKFVTSVAF